MPLMAAPSPATPPLAAPLRAPALAVGVRRAVWLSEDGEIEVLTLDQAAQRAQSQPPLVCHRPSVARRLGIPPFPAYDLLELFAFARPAQFCLPTPNGLADALAIGRPDDLEGQAICLMQVAETLLAALPATKGAQRAARLAMTMARAGWRWGPAVLAALPQDSAAKDPLGGLDAWVAVEGWSESAPEPPPEDHPISPEMAKVQLGLLMREGDELRQGQVDYAAAAAEAFKPRPAPDAPNVVLAEAGTGIGKTLGYVAPASLWAERNGGTVWISTYTKNLQRQVDQELDRLYPQADEKRQKLVVRKGRENYACLLNFDDAVRNSRAGTDATVLLGLVARWIGATRDGDMIGGDFPAWLGTLFGPARVAALTDHRGECIHSACPHYRKCFIEIVARRARHAELVIANHALVMTQAAMALDASELPNRLILDEGHHLFDAADNAFGARLSGREGAELRRWLLGREEGRRGRARGLNERVGDLLPEGQAAIDLLQDVLHKARLLPSSGWLKRVAEGAGVGAAERFLAQARLHVLARAGRDDSGFGLEATTNDPAAALVGAAEKLAGELNGLHHATSQLHATLTGRLDDEADELDSGTRMRIERVGRGLLRRLTTVAAWRDMLGGLVAGVVPDEFVDRFELERIEGRDLDVALSRHWVDPTKPFHAAVLRRAHGAVITSATLRDRSPEAPDDWRSAEVRTGAAHLILPPKRASLASPFDYPARTRVYVVTDLRRDDADQVAAAYRELFKAAGGGALGLFTAVHRLRGVYRRIAGPLEDAGLMLLAQHVDPMDTGTLVDIFRAETDACLLGTDAVRDGVDVPGRSLRLIVFDRVPWARPDILHRARRAEFGGKAYDDMLARLRLKQAYGRLLRRQDDKGVFVLLDRMMPSRLATAFPEGVEVERTGLAEVIAGTAAFLSG